MRMAHILGYLAPRYGGPPQAALRLGRTLHKLNVEVSWWATATREEQDAFANMGAQVRLFPATFPRSWYRSPGLHEALRKEIQGLDLLHLHQVWDYPLYAAAQLAQQHGKPYVVTPHGIFSQTWRYATPKKRAYLRLIARPFLNRAACMHAIVPAELRGFAEAGIRAPYTVVPNGIDPVEFAHLPAPGEADARWPGLRQRLVALFLGRLSAEKGLDQLIPAWRRVVRQQREACLLIAGPDQQGYRANVEALIEREGLHDHVLMTGMLQGREKLMALSRADLFVQPSYSEGFSLSILEALACGKPCAITTGCNFPELGAIGAGEVVEPQADTLSAALSKLLALAPQERQEMGERGRSLVMEQYTWDVVARRMLTVYRCIAEHKPIPVDPEPSD